MKKLFTFFFSLLALVSYSQSEADLLKIQNSLLLKSQGLATSLARSGPGSSCFNAIQVYTQTNIFEGQSENGNAEIGPDYGCLFDQPNPTWFKINVSSEIQVNGIIYSSPSQDIDFIMYETSLGGYGCNELTGQNIVDCSYSISSIEQFGYYFKPNKEYYLLVTNFSNEPCTITLDFQNSNIPFVNSEAFVLSGQIYFDENLNCDFDFEEQHVGFGLIKSSDLNIAVPVLSDGTYTISLPFYTNQTFAYTPFNNSDTDGIKNCNGQIPTWSFIPDTNGLATQNVGIEGSNCPIHIVSNFSALTRRCFANTRFISYTNLGNLPLNDAYIKLTYDLNEIIPINFSVPYTQSGNEFIIQIGNLEPFQFGSFTITDSLRCENGIGSSVSVTAEILPLSSCLPPESTWDQSDLLVYSSCSNNAIDFKVVNAGLGNMSSLTQAIVYENSVSIFDTTLQLQAGGQTIINVPAQENKTYTLVVNETQNNPFNQTAWASGECYSGEVFTGIEPFFMPQDQQPNIDQDIKIVLGAYDPNDKQAIPYGLGAEKVILKTDELEYTIRFQNTGNDTAFNVVVRDELTSFLEPASFQMVGASHPYTFILQNNQLTVKFQNIQLPDSASNPSGSQGFFVFKIKLSETLQSIYNVDNQAYIYFDFNSPILTNICRRQVKPQLSLAINENNPLAFSFFPNPTNQTLNIILDNAQANFTYSITDLQGRIVLSGQSMNDSPTAVDVSLISNGSYLVMVTNNHGKTVKKFIKM